MRLYEELLEKKKERNIISFNNINEKELLNLFTDASISDMELSNLFTISVDKVLFIRKLVNLLGKDKILKEKNQLAKAQLVNPENVNRNVNALIYYLFHDNPLEKKLNDQINEEDIMEFYKNTANKLAKIIINVFNNNWQAIEQYIDFVDLVYTRDWNLLNT